MSAALTFIDRATEGIRRRIPVIPLLPRSKKTYVGAKAATLDSNAIIAWNKENADYNCGFVAQAKPGGVWILDCDSPEVAREFEKATGRPFPRTFAVQSSSGGHRYFRQNESSLTRLKNFSVTRDGKEFFSVRWDNMYCAGPLSVHPDTGNSYNVVCDVDPIEAPDFVIDWLLAQADVPTQSVKDIAKGTGDIPDGMRDTVLTSIAGTLRDAGFGEDAIYEHLYRVNGERCKPPKTDADILRIAHSIAKHEDGIDRRIKETPLIGGVPAGSGARAAQPVTTEEVMDNLHVPAESKTFGLQIEDMPDAVLSGRLGEVVQKRMSIFPIAYSWLSLVAQAGVFVPSNGPLSWRPNIFYSPVGPSGSGKTEALKYAQYLLGLRSDTDDSFKHRYLLDVMPSSGEGLLDFIGDVNGDPRIVNPEEMSFLLERAALEGSSLPQMLDRSFNQTAFHLTKTRTRKEVFFNCRMTLVGGITMDHKDDYECVGQLFGVKSLGGFFSRYCFGLNPTNSSYYYKPFAGGPALSTESLQPVRLADDIFEANKAWVRELSDGGSRDEAARIFEVALRVYGICAAFDGKTVLTASDIERPIKAFTQYQRSIRDLIRPNPGVTPDGQLTAAFFSYLRRHAPNKERCEIREMLRTTNAYKYGSILCDRVINAMERNGEVETFYSTPSTGGRRKGWIWLTE